jgi:hypothetical protein
MGATIRSMMPVTARSLQDPGALDEHLLGPVHHDFRDGRIGQQRLQQPQADRLVAHRRDQRRAIDIGRNVRRAVDQLGDQLLGAGVQFRIRHPVHVDPPHVERLQQPLLQQVAPLEHRIVRCGPHRGVRCGFGGRGWPRPRGRVRGPRRRRRLVRRTRDGSCGLARRSGGGRRRGGGRRCGPPHFEREGTDLDPVGRLQRAVRGDAGTVDAGTVGRVQVAHEDLVVRKKDLRVLAAHAPAGQAHLVVEVASDPDLARLVLQAGRTTAAVGEIDGPHSNCSGVCEPSCYSAMFLSISRLKVL